MPISLEVDPRTAPFTIYEKGFIFSQGLAFTTIPALINGLGKQHRTRRPYAYPFAFFAGIYLASAAVRSLNGSRGTLLSMIADIEEFEKTELEHERIFLKPNTETS